MQVLKENTHNEYPQNLFESGVVFKIGESETGVVETCSLAVALCNKETDYTKIRQVLDYLLKSVGLKYEIKQTSHPSFIPGRIGKIIINKKEIGVIGELSPEVISNFEVEMAVSGFEVDLDRVFSMIH